jgi:hypothetical protein
LIDGMSDGESLEFTTAAKQYCSVVDRAGQAENTDVWLAEVATALLRASLAVRMLPAPEGQAGAGAAAVSLRSRGSPSACPGRPSVG